MKNNSVRRLTFTALCIALGVVLPIALHAIPGAGSIFLPMHIPVLLCGLVCGWPYGLVCGALAPLLSSLLTGMPPAGVLPGMLCELATYGLTAGLFARYIKIKPRMAGLYVQLILAMLCGRAVNGVLNALIFSAGSYSMQVFVTAAFVKALPGIVIQLVLLPLLVLLLEKMPFMASLSPQVNKA
nr:ECF transporter S component [Maliibacterium massiliense]